ncbi:MAG TPA: hypothetical protein VJM48_02730 [Methylibium sp.]|nr:hypothetical protein [Methylibium sp.]
MKSFRRLLVLLLVAVLTACAPILVVQVPAGQTLVGGRIQMQLDGPWNSLDKLVLSTATTWTVEGVTVDTLQFFVGIKDGAVIAPGQPGAKEQRPLSFKASMAPHEVVALYQTLWTRDGSSFTLDKLEPVDFLGGRGFRFDYTLLRKADDVRLAGFAYALVKDQELFVIHYSAPRLGFFPRYRAQVEQMAVTARLKG